MLRCVRLFVTLSYGLYFCDPRNCSLASSSVHGIFQARIFEWVAISNFRRSSWLKHRQKEPLFLHWQAVLTTYPLGKPALLLKNGLLWERINNILKCHCQQIQERSMQTKQPISLPFENLHLRAYTKMYSRFSCS